MHIQSLYYFLGTIFPVTYNAPLCPPTHLLSPPPLSSKYPIFVHQKKNPRPYNLSVKLISKGQFKMFTFLPVINIFQNDERLVNTCSLPPSISASTALKSSATAANGLQSGAQTELIAACLIFTMLQTFHCCKRPVFHQICI